MYPFIWSLVTNLPGYLYVDGLVKDFLINVLKTGPIPSHLSFVMDGNRTFAKKNGLPLKEGHRRGADALMEVLKCCIEVGVKNMTVYAFSIENFNRSQAEIDTIFDLLLSKLVYISEDNQFCDVQKLRIKIIGNRSLIPEKILEDIVTLEEKTAGYREHTLFVAFPYTSRDDITHSIRQIVGKVKDGQLDKDQIDQQEIERNFYYEGEAGKVDILVRTSGHTRLSDYMLWQCHMDSVIELPTTLWPSFRFYSTWWTIFKWSYYKTLLIEDAEQMQIKKLSTEDINKRYRKPVGQFTHPPYVSVTRE
ncbi:DEKNAAC100516 [Brettanomyces naardenensis]|uniref:Alkyl transferase n=1 Tax=Brettanomyces naardenensis TaxID=13370 RepID=A0A448YEC1_BRENA|nr:DEKNAAC100516 [Brettanomyces naardenensis]